VLERLHCILGVCVSDRIVKLNQNEESLKEEGALAVVICALCDAPFEVAQEFDTVVVYYYYYYYYYIVVIIISRVTTTPPCQAALPRVLLPQRFEVLQSGIKSNARTDAPLPVGGVYFVVSND